MKYLLLIFYLISPSIKAFTPELLEIEKQIEELGTKVYWANSHPLCTQGLLGAYIPSEDKIFICQDNHQKDYEELLGTLKHEGWHAVQGKCNKNKSVLSDEELRRHIKLRDRKILHSYHYGSERGEAEARVIEQLPTKSWIKGVRFYCKQILKK